MRADRPAQARGGHAPARQRQPRRHPPQSAPGHGAVPGWVLHLPRDRDPARRGPPRRRGCDCLAAGLPPGTLEGRMADPLRRPAPPGAARRLDLPGATRRGAPAGRGGGAGVSHHDVVVVGTGLAGLTAAVRLAESGARVLVLAKGVGATHLSGGTIDVLGYVPDRVERPADALAELQPPHPYALVGADAVAAAVAWFKERIADGSLAPYAYAGGIEENMLLPSALGVPRPTAVVPQTMAAGDLRDSAPVCVVGLRSLKDFHAALLADNLTRAGTE